MFMNAAVGGAALLSVMLSAATPAQADPWFQNSKPPLQEMKVWTQQHATGNIQQPQRTLPLVP